MHWHHPYIRERPEDSNENTRSFGMSADIWQLEHQVCQSSLFVGGPKVRRSLALPSADVVVTEYD